MTSFLFITFLIGLITILVLLGMVKKISWHFKLSPWIIGAIVFIFNAILFGGVIFIYLKQKVNLLDYAPYAVVLSLSGWFVISAIWIGTKKERLLAATIGSSFYWGLLFFVLFRRITLKPNYPGEDMFMAALGLDMAILVVGSAAFLCWLILGWKLNNV